MMRGLRVGDVSAKYGTSTGQHVSAALSLIGFPAGAVSEADRELLGEQSAPGRVASGRFATNDAAIGLVVGTLVMLYLGSRVIEVPK